VLNHFETAILLFEFHLKFNFSKSLKLNLSLNYFHSDSVNKLILIIHLSFETNIHNWKIFILLKYVLIFIKFIFLVSHYY
jgi:hypothetical protein